jgi:hypothetical protein
MANTFFSNTGIDDALAGIAAAGTFISLHSTPGPGVTGANEISGGSYARVATTWAGAGSSADAGSQVTLNVPAGTTITHFGIWTLGSGGQYLGGGPLPNSEAYTGAGTYLLTPTLAGSG